MFNIYRRHHKCVKLNTFFEYEKQDIREPVYITSLNEVKHCVVTPIPSQFLARGTLSWKTVDFKHENYDAKIGQIS